MDDDVKMNFPVPPKARSFKIGIKGPIILLFLILAIVFGSALTTLDRNDLGFYKVIQSVNGNLNVRSNPGWYFKWFSNVTTWKEADTLYWSKWPDEGRREDTSIDVRFADGGVGYVSMNVRYMMPATEDKRLYIQKVFKNNDAFQLGALEQLAMQAS